VGDGVGDGVGAIGVGSGVGVDDGDGEAEGSGAATLFGTFCQRSFFPTFLQRYVLFVVFFVAPILVHFVPEIVAELVDIGFKVNNKDRMSV